MHILLADDYPNAAELLGEILSEFAPVAVTIDIATDGAQALAAAEARKPAAAVLDIDMPAMNGIDAAHAILALPGAAPLLIAITGNPANLVSADEQGLFDHILTKPFAIDALTELLWPP